MAFTYPWFLLGLLALAVPVIIHLFELRRPKRVLFTNVEFIREVKLVTAKQRKLKHLFVLLARIGFLIFLVLVFVQPYIPAPIQSLEPQPVVGVFVDATPSMQASREEKQIAGFEQAINQAQGLLAAYPTSTNFSLLNTYTRPLAAARYSAELDKLMISGRAATLSNAFNRLASGGVEQTFIFSDFQKNAFSAKFISAIDSTQKVFLVPVGSRGAQNVFVDSVWLDDAFVRSNIDFTLHIRLRNGGSVPVENCQVKLFVGEQQGAAFRVTVPLNGVANATAQLRLAGGNPAKCRVEIEDYPVTFDNSFYFTLQASPKIKVLDVAAEPVATRQLYANEPLFAYVAAKATALDFQVLEGANLVLVQGQPQLDASLRESLRRVAQRGGSVVLVPPVAAGGHISYNQLFEELGIGPVQWEAAGTTPLLRDVAVPAPQNPFFKDVFGFQNRQTVMPKASPVLRWSRSGTDILRMRDGDGFLASFPSGKGTVYLFSSPFDDAYSNFTQHALFVPVMYRLAMQSYQQQQQPAYRLNQGTIAVNVSGEVAPGGAEQVFKLVKDSLTFIPVQRLQAGVLRFDVPLDMREPGFYSLMRNNKVVATLAFNFDKRESNLAAYSAEDLRQLIGPNHPNVQVYEVGAAESVAAKYRAERVGMPLWQYCLWGALLCLLAEVLLLRFMGQPKAAGTVTTAA